MATKRKRRRLSLGNVLLQIAFARVVAGIPGMPPVPPSFHRWPAPEAPPVPRKRIPLPPVDGHPVTLEIP